MRGRGTRHLILSMDVIFLSYSMELTRSQENLDDFFKKFIINMAFKEFFLDLELTQEYTITKTR